MAFPVFNCGVNIPSITTKEMTLRKLILAAGLTVLLSACNNQAAETTEDGNSAEAPQVVSTLHDELKQPLPQGITAYPGVAFDSQRETTEGDKPAVFTTNYKGKGTREEVVAYYTKQGTDAGYQIDDVFADTGKIYLNKGDEKIEITASPSQDDVIINIQFK